MAYRKENGRQTFYDKLYDSVYEIEVKMGSVEGIEGIAFQSAISDLRESINKVAEAPGNLVSRAALAQSAVEFIDKSQLIYNGLVKYQKTIDDEVVSTVNRINEIGDTIRNLNQRISRIEANDVEQAMDLRDKRDNLLDELSKYCRISYKRISAKFFLLMKLMMTTSCFCP
mgnify:CR=1 FL=1